MSKPKTKHRTGAAATINPDHVGMHRLIVAGVVVTLLAAVVTSWTGLVWVGEQQQLPEPVRWITPVMVDVPLVVLTLARGALAKRGVKATGIVAGIGVLTLFSSSANLLHTVAVAGLDSIPTVLGALTNAIAPWLILAMTEVLWLVVTRQPRPTKPRPTPRTAAKRPARPARTAATPAPVAEPERDPLAALRETAA